MGHQLGPRKLEPGDSRLTEIPPSSVERNTEGGIELISEGVLLIERRGEVSVSMRRTEEGTRGKITKATHRAELAVAGS